MTPARRLTRSLAAPPRRPGRSRWIALSATVLMAAGAASASSAYGNGLTTPTPSATAATATTTKATVTATPSAKPTPTPAPAPVGAGEDPPVRAAGPALSGAQMQGQVALAYQLRRSLLVAANAGVEVLSAQATAALEALRAARERQQAAKAEMLRQLARLTSLQGQVDDSQADLGRWARESYTTGGPMASYETWITALRGGATDDVGHDLAVLEHVGLIGSMTLDRLEVATAAQKDAARRAASAATAAAAARASADAAKKGADALLRQQREALAALQVEQMRTVGAVALTRQQLMSSGSAAGFVAEAELAATLKDRAKGKAVALDPDDCTGLDTSPYANGEIPTAALCPVWGAPGQLLRADAAAAFRDVSREFALAFGTPICVNDSYRTRAGQVAVFAAKPGLAAVPGTSNHGWGTAVDLCGGIESFGSAEHAWLLANASLHGWFHPAWAEPGGSKPEAWHWEFAG